MESIQTQSVSLPEDIHIRQFKKEDGIENLIKMIETELSEPYSIFLYRHFVLDYPEYSLVAVHQDQIVGCIIGKIDEKPSKNEREGYIAMLVVKKEFRRKNIAKKLVEDFIDICDENKLNCVVLETELINKAALRLYESKIFFKKIRMWILKN